MKGSATSSVLSISTGYDIPSVAIAYAENIGKQTNACPFKPHKSHVFDLIVGELRNRAFFSPVMSSMFNFVGKVSRPSVISEIGHNVVRWVAVVMAAIHSVWPFAYKSKQNKIMDVSRFSFPAVVKVYRFPIYSVGSLGKNFSLLGVKGNSFGVSCNSIHAPNTSKVRDFIKTVIAGDWLPDFLHVVAPSNAPKCKIHGSQWSDWFSGANLAMSLHYTKEAKNVSF